MSFSDCIDYVVEEETQTTKNYFETYCKECLPNMKVKCHDKENTNELEEVVVVIHIICGRKQLKPTQTVFIESISGMVLYNNFYPAKSTVVFTFHISMYSISLFQNTQRSTHTQLHALACERVCKHLPESRYTWHYTWFTLHYFPLKWTDFVSLIFGTL